jgi:hypothetical protein
MEHPHNHVAIATCSLDKGVYIVEEMRVRDGLPEWTLSKGFLNVDDDEGVVHAPKPTDISDSEEDRIQSPFGTIRSRVRDNSSFVSVIPP